MTGIATLEEIHRTPSGASSRSVVILMACHNRRSKTLRSLQCISDQIVDQSTQIAVALYDDGSVDGTSDAVREQFPTVWVHHGAGQAFWSRSMAEIHAAVLKKVQPRFLLWLNDDVVLDENAVKSLLAASDRWANSAAVVGALRDPVDGHTTYSGFVRAGSRPLQLSRLDPDGVDQFVDTFNGNVVLLPRTVYEGVGPVDASYAHALGDVDYGYRVSAFGFKCVLIGETVGTCPRNSALRTWQDPAIGALNQVRQLLSPKGVPLGSAIRFQRKYGGIAWPVNVVGAYARATLHILRRKKPVLRPSGELAGRSATHLDAASTKVRTVGQTKRRREAVVVTAVLPSYRTAFVSALLHHLPNVKLLTGDEHLDATVRTGVPSDTYARVVNFHLFSRRALLQVGAHLPALLSGVAVVDLNPRSLTAWWVLIARGVLRRRTLVWGHLHPRAGADAKTAPLRRVMRSLADGVITYTWSDRDHLIEEGYPATKIWVAANALYGRESLGVGSFDGPRNSILIVGRLVDSKRPVLAIEAFAKVDQRVSANYKLDFVGSGELMSFARDRVEQLGLQDQVVFHGQIDDVDRLRDLHSAAVVACSPGYVGLSLTQALGFGVPMIIPDDEPHAPEIELAIPGLTCEYFTARDVDSLARSFAAIMLGEAFAKPERNQLVELVSSRYSAEAMADGFSRAITGRPLVEQSDENSIGMPIRTVQ
jgi:GT2 family glycosyltransferase